MSSPAEVVKDVKDNASKWWNNLSKEARDILLVSAGVLGGIALVYVTDAFSEDDSVDDSDEQVTEEGPVLEEMKQKMKAANTMAKYAKKMANKAIKNADKAIAATKSKN
jgi:hypothetical protein